MIRTGSSNLAHIGTGLQQDINAQSKEIHAKRFLENKHTDIKVHYLPYLSQFLIGFLQKSAHSGIKKRLEVIIDGSQTGSKHVTLMLSVVVSDRSIPLFWVVRAGKKGHFPSDMHTDLVEQGVKILQDILLAQKVEANICLLGDGEFDSIALQRLCRETLQIDYVFRTACDTIIYYQGEKLNPKQIHDIVQEEGQNQSFFIPDVEFSKQKLEKVHFLYWFDATVYDNPLFLISSLDNAADIKAAYIKRFKIETMFKDLKSRGFNLHKNRLGSIKALTNLIIIAALSFCIMLNFGIQNEDNSLKIKIQRIDKKINSVFTYAKLLFNYFYENEIEFSIIEKNIFTTKVT